MTWVAIALLALLAAKQWQDIRDISANQTAQFLLGEKTHHRQNMFEKAITQVQDRYEFVKDAALQVVEEGPAVARLRRELFGGVTEGSALPRLGKLEEMTRQIEGINTNLSNRIDRLMAAVAAVSAKRG